MPPENGGSKPGETGGMEPGPNPQNGGGSRNSSGDPRSPGKVTDIAQIRKKVEERRQAEAAGGNPAGPGGDEGPDMKGGSGGGITSGFVRKCLNANELGDGMLFAEQFRHQYLFIKNFDTWYRWTGHFWERDILDRGIGDVEAVAGIYLNEAKRLVGDIDKAIKDGHKEKAKDLEDLQSKIYKRVLRLRSDRGRLNTLKFAHTNPENAVAVGGDEFDQDPWVLGCLNGVIDLRTGQIRPGRREDWITKVAPTEWHGLETPAPTWERFLAEIFLEDQDLIDFLGRLLGYAVTGLTVEHILPVLVGQGRNGKGTIVESLYHALGPLATAIPSELLLDQGRIRNSAGPSPDIMALRGARIAVAAESDENRRFSHSKVKWLTGGDTLTARNPHDRELSVFSPTHTLILQTNHEPNAASDDFAFWERVAMVPFALSFVTRKPSAPNERPADIHLLEKLKAEAPGILAWLVRGCLAWQRHGLSIPPTVRAATDNYRRDQDRIQDWFDECCYKDPASETKASDAYDNFRSWWEKNVSKKTLSNHKFGKWLTRRFPKEKSGVYVYYGFGLQAELGDLGR